MTYTLVRFFVDIVSLSQTDRKSGTATCQVVITKIGRTRVAVVDCPGFNDTYKSDVEVLVEIAKVLSTQYLIEQKLQFRGILWLQDITKTRMHGSDMKTLDLFCRLIGEAAFKHVVLVSTMWNKVKEEFEDAAYDKEAQLTDDFWREMILGGSYAQRFLGTRASAEGIISQLVGSREPVVLQIQRELVDGDMKLSATAAGSVLALGVEEDLETKENRVERSEGRLENESNGTARRRLKRDLNRVREERDRVQSAREKLDERIGSEVKSKMRGKLPSTWQETTRTICSVVGVSISVVGTILTAAGVACTVM
jgi:hypothetical protein